MSTVSYALITARREKSPSGKSKTDEPPGVGVYVDMLAALVPGEILLLHALYLEKTMTTTDLGTEITHPIALLVGFGVMIVFCIGFYAFTKYWKGQWEKIDFARMFIPAGAFITWTMIQKDTAFDAVLAVLKWSPVSAQLPRYLIGISLGCLLLFFAGIFANKADRHSQKNPARTGNHEVSSV